MWYFTSNAICANTHGLIRDSQCIIYYVWEKNAVINWLGNVYPNIHRLKNGDTELLYTLYNIFIELKIKIRSIVNIFTSQIRKWVNTKDQSMLKFTLPWLYMYMHLHILIRSLTFNQKLRTWQNDYETFRSNIVRVFPQHRGLIKHSNEWECVGACTCTSVIQEGQLKFEHRSIFRVYQKMYILASTYVLQIN